MSTSKKYKVRFNIAYPCSWKPGTVNYGQMHYVGDTIDEAISKVRKHLSWVEDRGGYCSSMWIMRGLPDRRTIKWSQYRSEDYP